MGSKFYSKVMPPIYKPTLLYNIYLAHLISLNNFFFNYFKDQHVTLNNKIFLQEMTDAGHSNKFYNNVLSYYNCFLESVIKNGFQ